MTIGDSRSGSNSREHMGRRVAAKSRSGLLVLEATLWLAFLLCAGYLARARYLAWSGARQAVVAASARYQPQQENAALAPARAISGAERLGTLEIPALALSVPVFEGDDTPSLTSGIGHIPRTALPGGLGTMALAGHRDTFLRSLANVMPRMEIRVTSTRGVYRYQVDSTEIVLPDAVRVLETVDTPSLVLITCYPFHYIGAAPKRFIVHAHLISLLPG